MGVIVTFNYPNWIARYPEFSNVYQTLAQQLFNEAQLYHRNDGGGPIDDPTTQLLLLGMIVAHLAFMSVGTALQPASGLVGRINHATQGSVSVGTEIQQVPGTAAWFVQTIYGFSYWQLMTPFRTAHYVRGHPRRFGPSWGGRLW